MNKIASVIVLSFVVASFWPFFGKPLQAQQAAPSLHKVLAEGLAAYKSLTEREATTQNSSFESYHARGSLTYALLRVGQRQAVDDLFSDEAEKRLYVATTEALLVEATGEVPEIAGGMAPAAEMVHRQMISISLAKRGDFKKANEQIAAIPNDGNVAHFAVASYQFVAKRQLAQQDFPGARETIRRLWSYLRDLEHKDRLRKAEWIIDLANMTSQAGEQAPAQKLCLIAEKTLSELREIPGQEPRRVNDAMRALSIAHAMSGNADQARALLVACEQQALNEDAQDKSERLFTMAVAHAEVAHWSGQKDVALAAYDRALKLAKKIHHDSLVTRKNPLELDEDLLELDEFFSGLVSLMEGTNFRIVALGQLNAGDRQAALETWEGMPDCAQKLATLLEMAKTLHTKGATAEARKLAARCAELDHPEYSAQDIVVITALAANIYRAIGDDEAARAAVAKLQASPRVNGSLDAKKKAACELSDFQLFEQSYSMIQTIESPADRALPLAILAEKMAKSGHR
jgi:hypothetical protein